MLICRINQVSNKQAHPYQIQLRNVRKAVYAGSPDRPLLHQVRKDGAVVRIIYKILFTPTDERCSAAPSAVSAAADAVAAIPIC
jgi:hypothetical protein